ncbi:MAG: GNAT family N-acetyltransferase [Sphingosinicella sp.]|nr:GNAT family N-acetyltransferase [Sphingosinicella sp.]
MIEIRFAQTADHDQWLPLWLGYNEFYGRSGDTALHPDINMATWKRLLDPAKPMWALVALSDQRLVGIAHYLFHPSTTDLAPACYLRDLFTIGDQRGRGVGQKLVEAVCANARRAGSDSIYWQTHEGNAQARRLYDQIAQQSEFLIYRKPC